MNSDKVVELTNVVEIAEDVKRKVKNVGVKNLDIETASELGVFQRMSNLLCVMHTTICAAYRIFGGIDCALEQLHGKKHSIKIAMNNFENAFDKFVSFWTDFYAKGKNNKDVMIEAERLYHNIMRWMRMPESWSFGEPQRTEEKDYDIVIVIDDEKDDKVYTFRTTVQERDVLESKESWCVFAYDGQGEKQQVTNYGLDENSAKALVEELSTKEPERYYTAAIIRESVEKKKEAIPFVVFKNGVAVGETEKTFKV